MKKFSRRLALEHPSTTRSTRALVGEHVTQGVEIKPFPLSVDTAGAQRHLTDTRTWVMLRSQYATCRLLCWSWEGYILIMLFPVQADEFILLSIEMWPSTSWLDQPRDKVFMTNDTAREEMNTVREWFTPSGIYLLSCSLHRRVSRWKIVTLSPWLWPDSHSWVLVDCFSECLHLEVISFYEGEMKGD